MTDLLHKTSSQLSSVCVGINARDQRASSKMNQTAFERTSKKNPTSRDLSSVMLENDASFQNAGKRGPATSFHGANNRSVNLGHATKTVRVKHNLKGAHSSSKTKFAVNIRVKGSSTQICQQDRKQASIARPQSSYKIRDGKLLINNSNKQQQQ